MAEDSSIYSIQATHMPNTDIQQTSLIYSQTLKWRNKTTVQCHMVCKQNGLPWWQFIKDGTLGWKSNKEDCLSLLGDLTCRYQNKWSTYRCSREVRPRKAFWGNAADDRNLLTANVVWFMYIMLINLYPRYASLLSGRLFVSITF